MSPAGRQRGWLYLVPACGLAALLGSCMGGGGGAPPPPPPPPPSITTTTLPDGTTRQNYSQTLQASGGTGALNWSLPSGNLPGGLSLSSAGVISGTPSGIGTSNFTVQVQDSATPPRTAAQALSIRVATPLGILTTSLSDGTVGVLYHDNIVITGGGPGPFSASITTGSLPPGLLSSSGNFNGTPTVAGTFAFTVQVQDSANPPRKASAALVIRVFNGLTIITASLPAGTVQSPYSAKLDATEVVGNVTWSVTSGASALMAAGLTLNSVTGEISGTLGPTPGPVSFTVQVMDSASPPRADSKPFTITLAPATGVGKLGRNDVIGNATPLSNGTYQASISPLVDPPNDTVANADVDVYKLTANSGAIVSVEITAERLPLPSPLDSVIEIVDGTGARLQTCRSPGSTTALFNEACMNDDIGFFTTDSALELQVPAGGPLTFYVRVLDFRGDARPDFIYTITIAGVN